MSRKRQNNGRAISLSRHQALLDEAEGNYTMLRISQLLQKPLQGYYDFSHLCAFHKHIFQDVYQWAGVPRTIELRKFAKEQGIPLTVKSWKAIMNFFVTAWLHIIAI